MRISDCSSDVCSSDLEKLRLSATRRKASIPSSAPWGIVKSCFKALADYRGLSIGATVPKKVAQRNERNLSHGLSALLFPPLPLRLRDRCRLRSEEHTSELQSLMRISYAVFCLKKKKKNTTLTHHHT